MKTETGFAFNRGNISVVFESGGCWVELMADNGSVQQMALEPSEMLLLYMALGDYFEHEEELLSGRSNIS